MFRDDYCHVSTMSNVTEGSHVPALALALALALVLALVGSEQWLA